MSRTGDRSSPPRAVIHKRILDAAESDPGASMEAIAGRIGGASTELVERVLERYGDPAGEGPDGGVEHASEADHEARVGSDADGRSDRAGADGSSGLGSAGSTGPPDTEGKDEDRDGSGSSPSAGAATTPDSASDAEPDADTGAAGRDGGGRADLTDGQLRALRLVAADPEASQREIAEGFDVTRATISRWLSDVEGFEWASRREDAARILDGDGRDGAVGRSESEAGDGVSGSGTDAEAAPSAATGSAPTGDGRFGELGRRLDAVERRLEDLETGAGSEPDPDRTTTPGTGSATAGFDPDLAHRVVHACMSSDRITEEEELLLLRTLMA